MPFPSKVHTKITTERRDTYLATGTTTRYFHSSQIRFIDCFLVGGGGSGAAQNNGGSTLIYGGMGGGVGAFRMDLLKVCEIYNSGRHMVFTATTSIGSGGAGVTVSASSGVITNGNVGGRTTITIKGTTTSGNQVGAIFKSTGGRIAASTNGTYNGGGASGTSVDTFTDYLAYPNFLIHEAMISPIALLGGSFPVDNIFIGCGTLSQNRSVGIVAEGYITSVGGGGGSNQAGGTHADLQLPQWVLGAGITLGAPGAGASSAGGGAASFNGAGGAAATTGAGNAATGYGGGGGSLRSTNPNTSGAGAPGVAAISAVRH